MALLQLRADTRSPPATREIWAVATVENWGSPRPEHNAGGPHGELVITLAGALASILSAANDGDSSTACGTSVGWSALLGCMD